MPALVLDMIINSQKEVYLQPVVQSNTRFVSLHLFQLLMA